MGCCVVAIYPRIYCVIKKYKFSQRLIFFDSVIQNLTEGEGFGAIYSTPARCKQHQQNKTAEIRGFKLTIEDSRGPLILRICKAKFTNIQVFVTNITY